MNQSFHQRIFPIPPKQMSRIPNFRLFLHLLRTTVDPCWYIHSGSYQPRLLSVTEDTDLLPHITMKVAITHLHRHQPQARTTVQRVYPPSTHLQQSSSYLYPKLQLARSPSLLFPPKLAWHSHYVRLPLIAILSQRNHNRYICRTCHKAFRPSTLRTHSSPHVGEKPFRCPHGFCAKALSVQRNMKRHERGCYFGRLVPSTTLVT